MLAWACPGVHIILCSCHLAQVSATGHAGTPEPAQYSHCTAFPPTGSSSIPPFSLPPPDLTPFISESGVWGLLAPSQVTQMAWLGKPWPRRAQGNGWRGEPGLKRWDQG